MLTQPAAKRARCERGALTLCCASVGWKSLGRRETCRGERTTNADPTHAPLCRVKSTARRGTCLSPSSERACTFPLATACSFSSTDPSVHPSSLLPSPRRWLSRVYFVLLRDFVRLPSLVRDRLRVQSSLFPDSESPTPFCRSVRSTFRASPSFSRPSAPLRVEIDCAPNGQDGRAPRVAVAKKNADCAIPPSLPSLFPTLAYPSPQARRLHISIVSSYTHSLVHSRWTSTTSFTSIGANGRSIAPSRAAPNPSLGRATSSATSAFIPTRGASIRDLGFLRGSTTVLIFRPLRGRPWVCEWPDCNRDFIQRSALIVHQRTQ